MTYNKNGRLMALCLVLSNMDPIEPFQSHALMKTASMPYITALALSSALPKTSPLPAHTFAGMVEQGLERRFGLDAAKRVIESWRLLDRGYEHKEYQGPASVEPSRSQCHQYCHSYLPGLTVKEFWDVAEFPWCAKLASKYSAITKEFSAVTSDVERLQREGNHIWAGALTEDASSYGEGWRTLGLMDRGRWDRVNVNLFPVTAQAIQESGAPAIEVFFASMKPQTKIKLHSDFTNFVLTSHLAVDIPYSGQNKCRLTIGDTTREWINGEIMVFDTSLMHAAANDSDKTRYILMLRIWHPDLSDAERAGLQFTFDCLEFPDLVSDDPEVRFKAEQLVEMTRGSPEVKKGANVVQGFGSKSSVSSKQRKKARR